MTARRDARRARIVSVDVRTGAVEAPGGATGEHALAHVLVRADGRPLGVLDVEALTDEELLARTRHLAETAFDVTVGQEAGTASTAPGAPPPLVTVVVPSLRNAAPTARCVLQVLRSTHPHLEVVVVDNDTVPGELEAEVRRAVGDDPRVRVVHEPRRGLSYARNCGWRDARGEIVIFTDDDVHADERWVEHIVRTFTEDPDVGCVTGAILPQELETTSQWRLEQYGGFNKGFTRQKFDLSAHRRPEPLYPYDSGRFGSGANLAFRAEVIRELGGFAVDLGAGTPAHGGEDLDVLRRVVSNGHALVYEPAALVWHAHRRSSAALRRQMFRYGVGLSATVVKWMLEDPRTARDVLSRLPAGVAHILLSSSRKNASKPQDYPRHLTWLERGGLLVGPVAYLRSRRRARSLGSGTAH